MLLTGFLPLLLSTSSLLPPRSTCQGQHHPEWAGPSHNSHHQSRKCPTDVPTGQPDGGIFSIEVSSSLDALACVKLTKHQPAPWARGMCLKNHYPQLTSGRFGEWSSLFPRLKLHRGWLEGSLLSCKEMVGKRQERNSWQSLAVS